VLVDFVGRYEQIDKDFEIIKSQLNLSGDLPKSNISKASSETRLDVKVVDRIKELYSKDFELFGY
jgi:hypothetical protein